MTVWFWKRKKRKETKPNPYIKPIRPEENRTSSSTYDDWSMNPANPLSITSPLNPIHSNWSTPSSTDNHCHTPEHTSTNNDGIVTGNFSVGGDSSPSGGSDGGSSSGGDGGGGGGGDGGGGGGGDGG